MFASFFVSLPFKTIQLIELNENHSVIMALRSFVALRMTGVALRMTGVALRMTGVALRMTDHLGQIRSYQKSPV
jgi:hypothetical protein